MDLRHSRLPWSEQIWAKINADLAQALTQARRVRGPFEVFHVADSQQTVMADKRDAQAENAFDYTESDTMPIIELAVNFSLAQSQVHNEGDNFYALDRIIGAAFDLGQAEDELLTSGRRDLAQSPVNGVRVSKTRDIGGGRIWEGIEYSDLSPDWKTPAQDLRTFCKFRLSVPEATSTARELKVASEVFVDDPNAANLIALRMAENAAVKKIADTCALEGVTTERERGELARELFSKVEKAVLTTGTPEQRLDPAIKEAAKSIDISAGQKASIISAATNLITNPPINVNLEEALTTALMLIPLCNSDAGEAEALARRIGQLPPPPDLQMPLTGRAIVTSQLAKHSAALVKTLLKAEETTVEAISKAAKKGFRPDHPPTVFWRGREGQCIPPGKTGFEVYNAVIEARDRLRKLSRYEAYALLISNDLEGDLQSTVPNTNSLNTPIERLRPLVTAGIYSTPSLGRRQMYVIAVARSWFDIAQAMEPSVQFLNINPDDGSYNLRLVERFAFRLKDGTARCKVVMCNEDG